MPRGQRVKFDAELLEGHKGVVFVIVPFDPEETWGDKPVRLAGRRHGWLVRGTVQGHEFEGYVGDRWGRFFVALGDALLEAAGLSVGDQIRVVLEPTRGLGTLRTAVEQSKRSTQPRTARPDAVVLEPEPRGARTRR